MMLFARVFDVFPTIDQIRTIELSYNVLASFPSPMSVLLTANLGSTDEHYTVSSPQLQGDVAP